jgi:hypothetical protein
MLTPIRLFLRSLKQFAAGLGPGLLLALLCLALQAGVAMGLASVEQTLVPATAAVSLVPGSWSDQAGDLLVYTLAVSVFFFFHALTSLILTAWLLRCRAPFALIRVLRRAARGAGLLTGAAAVLIAVSFFLDDILPATRYVKFPFGAAVTLALWFGGTVLLLPARLMGHEPATPGFGQTTLATAITLVPWFFASEVLGAPLRRCHDCAGLFDGGIVFYPLLGAYLLGLTVSSAAVSAAACMPTATKPATARAEARGASSPEEQAAHGQGPSPRSLGVRERHHRLGDPLLQRDAEVG